MTQEVIDQINELGTADGQPELLTFYMTVKAVSSANLKIQECLN